MPEPDVPKAEMIAELVDLIQKGENESTQYNLISYCRDAWGLASLPALKLIAQAKGAHAKGVNYIDREGEVASMLAKYERVYRGACEDREWSAAVKALQGSCTLLGLKG
jgi:hypothetical protein